MDLFTEILLGVVGMIAVGNLWIYQHLNKRIGSLDEQLKTQSEIHSEEQEVLMKEVLRNSVQVKFLTKYMRPLSEGNGFPPDHGQIS